MKNITFIKKICDDSIKEGESLAGTKWSNNNTGSFVVMNPTTYVDLERFKKWKSDCNLLMSLLGNLNTPWKEVFDGEKTNTLINTKSMIGGLKSIKDAVDKGYLLKIEDLVFAEAFSNLIEQAEYLFSQNYNLAAGVIARAVLEEKLRNLCDSKAIQITKSRPTLSDFNNELYKVNFYDKVELKNIDFLSSIGNNAAHNLPIKQDEVKKLIDGVKDILLKFN